MEWINVHVRTVLAETFLLAQDAQQAQWLRLLAYCATQENHGRIKNARALPDRLWARMAGVTTADVQAACSLWRWEGDDLLLEFYPQSQQQKLQNLRDGVVRSNRSRKNPPAEDDSNIESKLGSNIESKLGSNIESKLGSNIESKLGSNIESKLGSNIESKLGSNIESNIDPSKVSDSKVKEGKGKDVSVSAPTAALPGEDVDVMAMEVEESSDARMQDTAEWPSQVEWFAAALMEGLPQPLAEQEWNNQERKSPFERWKNISRHRLRHHAAFVLGMARQRGGVHGLEKKTPAPRRMAGVGNGAALDAVVQQQQEVAGLHGDNEKLTDESGRE